MGCEQEASWKASGKRAGIRTGCERYTSEKRARSELKYEREDGGPSESNERVRRMLMPTTAYVEMLVEEADERTRSPGTLGDACRQTGCSGLMLLLGTECAEEDQGRERGRGQ
ncbi:MAG: hypothetical protein EBZ48_15235 [Proteobacteria bacterium]|nr:hypothetical protein [Pseudomonadota bacterium]